MTEVHVEPRIVEQVDALSSLLFVDEVADLSMIYNETANVVTLRRTPSEDLIADAERAAQNLAPKRFEISEGDKETALAELRDYPFLAADVQFLAEVLTDLTGCDSVGVRMARINKAMCPRFHVDKMTLRLVMTYSGPGTEFIANEHIDRRYLGRGSKGIGDESSGLLLAFGCIQRADTFDLVALKGTRWPNNEKFGAVHRSPAGSVDTPRLVMTLDPLIN